MRRKHSKLNFVSSRAFATAACVAICSLVVHSGCSKADSKPESKAANVVTEMNIKPDSSGDQPAAKKSADSKPADSKPGTAKEKGSDVDTLPFDNGSDDASVAPGLNSPK